MRRPIPLLAILCVCFLPLIAVAQIDLNKGLMAYYPFNGNANDASGNNNNPIFNNATLTADYYGKPKSAYHFNGIDNYMEIANSLSLNFGTTISLCAWVKPTGYYTGTCFNNMLLSKQVADGVAGNYSLRFSDAVTGCTGNPTTKNEVFYGPDGGIGNQSPVLLNQWYKVVFTDDGVTSKLYVNCQLVSSQPSKKNSYTNGYNFFLGHLNDPTYPYWLNGDLDEIRIYDRALNSDEVKAYSACTIPTVTASFTGPDTTCSGSTVNFTNTSVGATNYYWSFCAADFNTTPDAKNLGNPGSNLNSPVFMDYILDDNGNYYGFISNYTNGHLIKLNYGNSLLNTPTSTDLGNFNTILPYAEGIQVRKSNGKCYAFIVSAGNSAGSASQFVRVDFGASFSNPAPTAINFGNTGSLNFPHDLFITSDGTNYYGFTININNNTITRLDFGSDLANTPTDINLGSIGNLDYPCGLTFINSKGSWYAFVTNRNNNTLSRLSFGNSLTNIPTGINLGNPGNFLDKPRDISVFESCSGIVGLVVNEKDEQTGSITKLDFGDDLLSNPIATNLGNLGNLKFPHSISKFFLDGNDIYSFITNVANNTITRLRYKGCTSASIASSTQKNPPPVTYAQPGTYNINLLVDVGLPTQTSYCKQLIVKDCTPTVTASFTVADTTCINTPVQIINTSTNATSYYWSFCQADINKDPEGQNLGSINSVLSVPVYSDIVLQNGNYYVFVVNNSPGGLTRLDFGSSLLNTPTSINLGNFGGVLETTAEGIQVVNTGNKWYGIIVGGSISAGKNPQILKLDFGTDVTNVLPVVTDWGNIGNMNYPHELYVFNENNNWYGFTANYENNTITRFDFGSDFSNSPTGTNLGTFNLLNGPTGLSAIKDNTNWYLFVTNGISNTITRLNFGTSLLNTPTAFNLGDLNGTMHKCWDISIQKYCDQIIGFVINGDDSYNDIVRLDFNNNLLSVPSAVSLGNIGNLSFPHSFSKLIRQGNDLYDFIPNAHNNTITRLKFSGCTNSSIPNTSQKNPPPITYDSAGIYNINLVVDEGLPTQTTYCKQILVQDCNNPCDSFKVDAGKDVSVCYGNSIQLNATGASTYNWNTSTKLNDTTIANPLVNTLTTDSFIVVGKNTSGTCSDTDTVKVSVLPLPVFSVNNDTSICLGNAVQLKTIATNDYHYHWSPPNYLSDTAIANPVSTPLDSIKYFVTAIDSFNCRSTDSIQINSVPPPAITTIVSASICLGDSVTLTTTITNANSYKWSPPEGLIDATIISPVATPTKTTRYVISAINNICATTDSVLITVFSLPDTYAGNDTTTCGNGAAQLIASGAATYNWQPSTGLSDTTIANPVASPIITTTYYVIGTSSNGCVGSDSIVVTKVPDPVFAITESDSVLCSGETLSLTASGGDVYAWSPAQAVSNPSVPATTSHPVTATNYSVTIYNSTCKVSDTLSTSVKVNTSPKITISKSNDIDCAQPDAQLNANGGVSYVWQPDTFINNNTIPNPQVNPPSDTWYAVTATASNSCTTTDSILIKSSIDKAGFLIASGFTPNGDGLNDCIGVKYWGIPASFTMMIYDKWGMPVYSSKNIDECWDGSYKGKKQGSGTYVYFITATNVCGRDKIFRKGTIVLIR